MHPTVVPMLRAEHRALFADPAVIVFDIVTAEDCFILHTHEANFSFESNWPHNWIDPSIDQILQIVHIQVLVFKVITDRRPSLIHQEYGFEVIHSFQLSVIQLHVLYLSPKLL
jgi:hypothetical protein